MPFFDQQFKASPVTIEEFWKFERDCTEMSHDEFFDYMQNRVRFLTPLQLEGALLCVKKEITNFLTPPDRQTFLSYRILPLIEEAIEHPFDPQTSLF